MSALSSQNDTWKKYVEDNCGVKQPVNLNEVTDPLDDVDETTYIETERENTPHSTLVKDASSMASMAVITIDLLLSNVAGMISGGDKEKYKLSSTERTDYTEAWANFLADKNITLSPGAMLLLVTGGLVIPRLYEANRERKERKLQQLQADTIEEQEAEIINLKKQLKNADRQQSSKV